jgi:hypothetical protein
MLIEQYPPTASGYTYNIPYLDGYGSYELYTSGSSVIKANDANYWKTNSGSNTTGLSLIGTGYRKADGSFA